MLHVHFFNISAVVVVNLASVAIVNVDVAVAIMYGVAATVKMLLQLQ